uniref:Uncharacterized protein n=1 Tax=Rhizophora mucronata TaxID=61149 RepID=A0A2P2KBN3_RHIMU
MQFGIFMMQNWSKYTCCVSCVSTFDRLE